MRGTHHARLPLITLLALISTGLSGSDLSLADDGAVANGKIAFVHYGPGDRNVLDIFVVNADGSGLTNVTRNAGWNVLADPAWSPDGTKIAFEMDQEIFVMNADGSRRVNLTQDPRPNHAPSWSPDGTKIAYETYTDSSAEIFVMNADGTDQRNLTKSAIYDFAPAWSPDGDRIAFYSPDSHRNSEIRVMNADGSDQTNLTNGAGYDVSPVWSPDGARIAFNSLAADGTYEMDRTYEILVMAADGSGRTNLTETAGTEEEPTWSPDGKFIAFAFGGYRLHVMSSDGSGDWTYLGEGWEPDWESVPVPDPSVTVAKAREGKFMRFEVNISAAIGGFVTYAYVARNGEAKRGKDFKRKVGTLTFAPGRTSRKVKVKTKGDDSDEPKETFFLEVSYPGGPSDRGKGKITDAD